VRVSSVDVHRLIMVSCPSTLAPAPPVEPPSLAPPHARWVPRRGAFCTFGRSMWAMVRVPPAPKRKIRPPPRHPPRVSGRVLERGALDRCGETIYGRAHATLTCTRLATHTSHRALCRTHSCIMCSIFHSNSRYRTTSRNPNMRSHAHNFTHAHHRPRSSSWT
jgi:hypothetical protein